MKKPTKHKKHMSPRSEEADGRRTQPLRPKRRRAKPPSGRQSQIRGYEPPHPTDGAAFLFARRGRFRRAGARGKLARSFKEARLAERRVLVRVREHLFLSGGAQGRRARRRAGREPCLAAVPARADLHGARLARLAVQHLSRQGPLHVARPRADLRARWAYPLKRPEPFPQPSLLAARVALALEDDARADFSRRVFRRRIRRGPADRRSRDARRLARLHAASMRRRRSSAPKATPTRRGSRPSAPGRRRSESSARRVS